MVDILLSDFTNQRIRTAGGDAVASDIMLSKQAVVNGVPLTGTALDKKPLNSGNGLLLYMQNPVGVTDAAYDPLNDHGALLVNDGGASLFNSTGWNLKANGDAWHGTSFAQYVRATLPAYSVRRKYEVWGKFIDDAMPDAAGIAVYSNYVDSNNYWYSVLRRATSWGGWYTQIREVTAGVNTARHDDGGMTSALDMPANFHAILIEQGDTLIWSVAVFETDDFSLDYHTNFYTIASRPHKSAMQFRIGIASVGGNNVQIQGCRVMDLA